jgi:Helix-turn-helix domain
MELNDEILTIQELAERLKVKKSTIYDLTRNRGRVRAGNRPLPCIKGREAVTVQLAFGLSMAYRIGRGPGQRVSS